MAARILLYLFTKFNFKHFENKVCSYSKVELLKINKHKIAKFQQLKLVFAPNNDPIRSLEFQNFSGLIGVDWELIYEDHFHY